MWVVHFIGGPWDGHVLDTNTTKNKVIGKEWRVSMLGAPDFVYKYREAARWHLFAVPEDWDSERLAHALLDAYAELKGKPTDKGAG